MAVDSSLGSGHPGTSTHLDMCRAAARETKPGVASVQTNKRFVFVTLCGWSQVRLLFGLVGTYLWERTKLGYS